MLITTLLPLLAGFVFAKPATDACVRLKAGYPNLTFYPGTECYKNETRTQFSYAASNYKDPKCVFAPQDARGVAFAVKTFTQLSTKFAVRSGGHMPIAGSNNIDAPGVLLSMTNLNGLALKDNNNVISIGAGLRWARVYDYLAKSGLVVVGGRLGEIGVSGLLLGGGLSFYSDQHGFASDNVAKYECVLANGSIVEATASNSHADLFWALKAGGNSFCVVTSFDLVTLKSPQVHVGSTQYPVEQAKNFLDAVYNFAQYGALDSKAALTPIVTFDVSRKEIRYIATRFYDSDLDVGYVWNNFSAPIMTPMTDDYKLQPLNTFINSYKGPVVGPLRRKWQIISSLGDRDAIDIIHSTLLEQSLKMLADRANATAGVAFQMITKEFIRQGNIKGGNPQGIDDSRAPYFWTVLQLAWSEEKDDDYMHQFGKDFTALVNDLINRAGFGAQYLFLNEAGEQQRVFQSYGADNLRKLKDIRAKYDPSKVFTELMPSGWKVDAA